MASLARMRVTGGFLDGLDLAFTPGLNVIVGPRGAGKTTLLELLRHVLALPHNEASSDRAGFLRHALGAGEVVLDLRTASGAERLVVDANGGGLRSEITADIALMLGQNELEEIADSPARRLSLIDARAGIAANEQVPAVGALRKLTLRAHQLRERQDEIRDLLRQKSTLLEDRQRVRDREAELLARSSGALAPERERLAALERGILQIQADLRGAEELLSARARIEEALSPVRDVVRDLKSTRLEAAIETEVKRLIETVDESLAGISGAADRFERLSISSRNRLKQEDLRLRAEAEPVRSNLDQVERGLGAVTAELRDLEAQISRLDSLEAELRELEAQEQRVVSDREVLQEEVENASEFLFDSRDRAARMITDQLDHRVQISVRHFADTTAFRRTLAELLQGYGLKQNVLADTLAGTTLPATLLRYVEQGDIEGLSATAGIPTDRAARVIAALDRGDALAKIASSVLNDSVEFRLQDGAVLKSVAQLSTGQKCAVTMPIVLTDSERIVVLDQPEDHLDNQFLVERIVTSLLARTEAGAQTIVATHNPNIPVLGGAGQVANLTSDGAHGAIASRGPYDSPNIVHVITSLMEGGREAFEQRAQFYAAH